jgi:hypothetical protein
VTRPKLHDRIAAAIEANFNGTIRRTDGMVRPHLDREDCRFIADLVLGEMGQFGLRRLQSKARNDNAPRP